MITHYLLILSIMYIVIYLIVDNIKDYKAILFIMSISYLITYTIEVFK